ncbi:leucine-rich repeat-containing protein [Tanacetum coccineum]|uniref:Leucine-rich repeat-containing protein n=1 Tax=Tanacetum coccineum TaxID=301880 RepID=A0ABQ5AR98_9ASTR
MMSRNTDCCNWKGVTFDDSTIDVVGLDVSCGRLSGTIHPNTSLFNHPHLHRLNLDYNVFNPSQIPREIGRNGNLNHLSLSHNNFIGEWELDTLLSSLTNLEILDLSYNGFSVTTKNANHYVNPGFRDLGLAPCKLKCEPGNTLSIITAIHHRSPPSTTVHCHPPSFTTIHHSPPSTTVPHRNNHQLPPSTTDNHDPDNHLSRSSSSKTKFFSQLTVITVASFQYILIEEFVIPSVRRRKRDGLLLVAFFGDNSYKWFDPSELIPFDVNFAEKHKQTNPRQTSHKAFVNAVEDALNEVSRRSALAGRVLSLAFGEKYAQAFGHDPVLPSHASSQQPASRKTQNKGLQEEKGNGNGKTEHKATADCWQCRCIGLRPVGVGNLLISEQLVKIPVRYP